MPNKNLARRMTFTFLQISWTNCLNRRLTDSHVCFCTKIVTLSAMLCTTWKIQLYAHERMRMESNILVLSWKLFWPWELSTRVCGTRTGSQDHVLRTGALESKSEGLGTSLFNWQNSLFWTFSTVICFTH